MRKLLLAILLIGLTAGCEASEEAMAKTLEKKEPVIVKSSIELQKDFLPKFNFERRVEEKTHVVLHFISNAARNPENPYVYEEIREIFLDYDVASHYLIDREGIIYFLLPENRVARHSGKGNVSGFPEYKDRLNDYSVGIELMAIGTEEEMQSILSPEEYQNIPEVHIGYTDAQYKSLDLLLGDILARNKKIKRDRGHIIGHDEYAPMRKSDPGSLFSWSKIIY